MPVSAFGIMLWRERRNAAFTINEEQSPSALVNCGRSATRAAIKRPCHIMLPHFYGESASVRGGKAYTIFNLPLRTTAPGDSQPGAFILPNPPAAARYLLRTTSA
jgi:hypothetical protein